MLSSPVVCSVLTVAVPDSAADPGEVSGPSGVLGRVAGAETWKENVKERRASGLAGDLHGRLGW